MSNIIVALTHFLGGRWSSERSRLLVGFSIRLWKPQQNSTIQFVGNLPADIFNHCCHSTFFSECSTTYNPERINALTLVWPHWIRPNYHSKWISTNRNEIDTHMNLRGCILEKNYNVYEIIYGKIQIFSTHRYVHRHIPLCYFNITYIHIQYAHRYIYTARREPNRRFSWQNLKLRIFL